jgi:Holliday junction resolvase-like predicted endonuclease
MTDFNMWDVIDDHLTKGAPLYGKRLPTFYPSAASCRNLKDENETLGGCVRAQYYRCAGFDRTNPSGLFSQYIFAAGNMWEDKITEWCKQSGIWLGNSVKFQDLDRYISGEVDIIIKNPTTGEKIIVENKTYSSANYQAKKDLAGGRDVTPHPKDQNLLQSFLYLDQFKGQGVSKVYLTYFDRACGGPENNRQFIISAEMKNGLTHPRISTVDRDNKPFTYLEERVSMEAIYEGYEKLKHHLSEGIMPPPDFKHVFSAAEVETKRASGIIAKTRYENYHRNAEKYPIGDWQCNYCDFKDLCLEYQKDGK